MSDIVHDPEQVHERALQKEKENDSLRDFLKYQDPVAIDAIVSELNEQVSAVIDCQSCGQCCKQLMISVDEQGLSRAAEALSVDNDSFKQMYLEESAAGALYISQIPCHFLAGDSCSIYTARFEDCRSFPHLDKPHFTNRLFSVMMSYAFCPIVYNVVERLKERTGFITGNA
jgi:uncharacterized protein